VHTVRQKVTVFRRDFGATALAAEQAAALDVLARIVADRPLYLTAEQLDAALDSLQRANPQVARFVVKKELLDYGVKLDLSACPQLKDLAPLDRLPLVSLNLNRTAVTDFRVLQGMPLEELMLNYTAIRDLSVLEGLPLRVLSLGWCLEVEDLRPLAGMPLRRLMLRATAVSNLRPLANMGLTFLNASYTQVDDIRVLATLKELRELDLLNLRIRDLEPLRDLPLTMLAVGWVEADSLAPLTGKKSLVDLDMVDADAALLVEGRFDAARPLVEQRRAQVRGVPAFAPWLDHLDRLRDHVMPAAEALLKHGGQGVEFIPREAASFEGHAYLVVPLLKSWDEAQAFAEGFGGYLASVTSEAEQAWLREQLVPRGWAVWLGATDNQQETVWRWVSGEAFNPLAWAKAQPDNLRNLEHWLMMGQAGNWYDASKQERYVFVLEWDR